MGALKHHTSVILAMGVRANHAFIPECSRNVLPLIPFHNLPDIRWVSSVDGIQERHQIQERVVTALKLPWL
jgi:hypothetical protein